MGCSNCTSNSVFSPNKNRRCRNAGGHQIQNGVRVVVGQDHEVKCLQRRIRLGSGKEAGWLRQMMIGCQELRDNRDGTHTWVNNYLPAGGFRAFNVGDAVQGVWEDGSWYDATVVARNNDGTFKIRWTEYMCSDCNGTGEDEDGYECDTCDGTRTDTGCPEELRCEKCTCPACNGEGSVDAKYVYDEAEWQTCRNSNCGVFFPSGKACCAICTWCVNGKCGKCKSPKCIPKPKTQTCRNRECSATFPLEYKICGICTWCVNGDCKQASRGNCPDCKQATPSLRVDTNNGGPSGDHNGSPSGDHNNDSSSNGPDTTFPKRDMNNRTNVSIPKRDTSDSIPDRDITNRRSTHARRADSFRRRIAEDNIQPFVVLCAWILALTVGMVVFLLDRRATIAKRDAMQRGHRNWENPTCSLF